MEPVLRVGPVTFIFFLYPLKKPSTPADTGVMAEETSEATPDATSSTPEVPEGVVAPVEAAPEPTTPPAATQAPETAVPVTAVPVTAPPSEPETPKEPDALQPFIDKAHATVQDEVDAKELNKFLRAHIKTFREEWESWSDSAKDTYTHMMTAQLLQRKAAAIQIGLGNVFKLPDPSAQTELMQSIQHSQVKATKRYPAIDLPPKLRGITF